MITFLTLIAGTGEDSVFGFGFFPGILALVIWSIASSDTCRKTNPCALTLGLPQRDLADELRHGGAQLVSDDLLELRGRGHGS